MKPGLSDANYMVLGLIYFSPRTGYELRKILRTTPLGGLSDSPGSIYPTLEKLEKCGLIKGKRLSSQNGGNKTSFSMTPAGRKAMYDWALLPLSEYQMRQKPERFSHKYPYLSQMAEPQVVTERLREYAAAMTAEAQNLQRIIDHLPPNRVGAGATIELGVELMKVHAKWARSQIKIYSELEKHNG